jgi:hypothetical protein
VNAYAAGVGDFNRDHHQDLALVGVKNSVVLLGKGDGTFTTAATLDTAYGTATSTVEFNNPIAPTEIYVGDLNQDGIPDLAIGSLSSSGAISVYYGKGNGTFNNPKPFSVGGGFASSQHPFFFGDMNRDGHIDVIVQTNGHYAIAYGTKDGGLNAPIIAQARMSGSIAKGDFNGDGVQDIAVAEEPVCSSCTGTFVRVFLGTAHGFLSPPRTYSIPVKWGAIAAGDVNRDGKVDLVVTRNANMLHSVSGRPYTTPDVTVLLGRGDGTFDAPASYTVVGAPAGGTLSDSVYLVDVNHDGKLDLVGDWGTALGNGAGQFARPIPLPSALGAIMAIAPGDFRNSGTVDLAVATVIYNSTTHGWSSPSTINTLSGNGSGSFTVAYKVPIDGFVNHLIAADMNADGTDDVLFTFSSNNGTSNWENLQVDLYRAELPYFGATYQWQTNFSATGLVTGDFNRDGKMDVAVFDLMGTGADVNVLFGTGNTSQLLNNYQYYQGAMNQGVVLDVNGDSAPDIAGLTTIGVARLLNTGHK